MDKEQKQIPEPSERMGCLGALMRISWMILGNIGILVLAVLIAQRRSVILTDILYWFDVGCLVLIRYADIAYFHGQNSEGERATMNDWRKYTVRLMLISAGLYIIVKIIAYSKMIG